MLVQIGVLKEQQANERRVALLPGNIEKLKKLGAEVVVEQGAGTPAGVSDQVYREAGADVVAERADVFARAEVVCAVRLAGADPEHGEGDLAHVREGQVLIGFSEPLWRAESVRGLAERKAVLLAMELIPRITRAQSMDALSSQANIAGYKAVLLAANELPRMLPMMMTAAGTIKPARVLVIGAGVAGLQAIATAKRLGAVVSAYDVRPAVKEQVESLGGKFVELDIADERAEDAGGYAKEQSEDQIRRQQELMRDVVAESHAVVTTAAIPGRKSPLIVTEAMVAAMAPGSVIVDLAAERGGNCALTQLGERVETDNGVLVLGPDNLPASVPQHASAMYANNVTNLVQELLDTEDEGAARVNLDFDDEVIGGATVCRDGEIVHPQVREALSLPPLAEPQKDQEHGAASASEDAEGQQAQEEQG